MSSNVLYWGDDIELKRNNKCKYQHNKNKIFFKKCYE